jgi:sec-independent protein translocase protein TatA
MQWALQTVHRLQRLHFRKATLRFLILGGCMFEGLFQPMHLLMIFGIALLVFGPKKLPELGKGIGEGIRGFKAAMKTDEEKPAHITTNIADDQSITKG